MGMTDIPLSHTSPLQDTATLAALSRRTLMLAAVLVPAILLTILLVVSETRTPRVADLAAQAIPRTLIAPDRVWTSTDMRFSPLEMQILETNDYIFRTYNDGKGTPVDLCVVFSEDNRKGTHPPDICLEGSGYRIVSRQPRTVSIANTPLTLEEIVATAGTGIGSNQYIYFAYFYKCGDTFTPSFYHQQMTIVWNGLTHRNAAGALIRYSLPMASASDLPAARARVDQLLAVTFPPIRDHLNPPAHR
jgi:EpsI family protein